MSTISQVLRYPRLVIIASYVAIVLGSLGLGMRIGGSPDLEPVDILPRIATILIGIAVLHHAYTTE